MTYSKFRWSDQSFKDFTIQLSKWSMVNDMSLLQDECLVSNRLKKSEQIIPSFLLKQFVPNNIQEYRFFCYIWWSCYKILRILNSWEVCFFFFILIILPFESWLFQTNLSRWSEIRMYILWIVLSRLYGRCRKIKYQKFQMAFQT